MMKQLTLSPAFEASITSVQNGLIGEVFHVSRNEVGSGRTLTPIARFYGYRPEFIESFNPHWRVDCYTRDHQLAPPHRQLGELLVETLKREEIIAEPIWMSAFTSAEESGRAYGDVFDFE
jgi:hypothetical protein